MYKGKKIAVVVPAYNERELITQVITTVPDFVDRIYAVNDASTDDTGEILSKLAEKISRLTVIHHEKNGGVGAAIISGHKMALKDEMDVVAIMAGDGQMDPAILDKIINPVVEGRADFAKGDRLSIARHRESMSAWRTFGNFLLTFLTRIASGYWHMVDPQNGYTAISREFLQRLDLDKIEKGFAFENDLLVKLNVLGARLVDVPHPAIYGKEHSKIRYHKYIVNTSWVLLKLFLWRLKAKYLDRIIFWKHCGKSFAKM
ncbi:MAG: glycosyltransferase family 2 protein [Pelotomaculum sp.]|uniref:Glycosyltransferases n=1 Tax=Pelotomaculum thermopropionicum (strain DSM 13744 / JCM 10971 / SI) TaxID=370438 RepID=A5D5A9_PELTS|nr:glycosyltransferase family 2 protein [Pelotomaculum sp.]BAF58563.1 glycosyltransferases [Pelotomaculum thermopropionicum SI]